MASNTLFGDFWYKALVSSYSYDEDVRSTEFVATSIVISLGLPLTLGAIYGLYSQVRNGDVAPIYVINLLLSDLVQFCCMIAALIPLDDYKTLEVFTHIYIYCLMASVGFMVCIALERYLVIVHPLWYRFRRTIKTSVLICVLVWILPSISVLIEYFIFYFMASLVVASIFFLLPLPLLIFFLIATLRVLSASISVPTNEKRRIAGMLVLVLLIYLLLFLPGIIVFLSFHLDTIYWEDYERASFLAPVFLKLSPLADLVLYIVMRKGTIRQLSACVCCCRKDSNEISAVTVDVDMSAVKDREREGERTEEV